MEIKPETVKKVAYPALAAVMAAAAFSSCDRQPQRIVGKVPAADSKEEEIQRTGGMVAEPRTPDDAPQFVEGIPPVPEKEPEVPVPPKPDEDQQIPGEPVEIPQR